MTVLTSKHTARPYRLGLTGGIGSGKSTVGQILAAAGAALIDADQISRDVTGPQGSAIAAIRTTFGDEFIDPSGALNRDRMRTLAFSQPEARARLEAIIHPLVGFESEAQANAAASEGTALIVFDVPLLAESGRWARRLDGVIVVDCDPETQVARVVQRNGLAAEAVQTIIASQADRYTRRAVGDVVITNGRERSLLQLAGDVSRLASMFGL